MIDSLPVFAANEKRSGTARVAPGLCAKSYCASQNKWYYGVKVHVVGQKVYHTLPNMMAAEVTPANESDISAAKEMLLSVYNITAFADKAYGSGQWQEELEKRGIRMYAPVKLEKGRQYLKCADHYFSQLVPQTRQAIESFFNRLNEKTRIQFASKVRSENGLVAFIFARLAVAAFYP
ncbi:MAG: transposase [Spirochaetaceae bacterium]|nr:transposase [Spirochaetaceae bacterium]